MIHNETNCITPTGISVISYELIEATSTNWRIGGGCKQTGSDNDINASELTEVLLGVTGALVNQKCFKYGEPGHIMAQNCMKPGQHVSSGCYEGK